MFATLLGRLPRPPLADDASAASVLDAVLALQLEHGLEPLTDGGWPVADDPVRAWRAVEERGERLAKAVMLGPFSAGSDGTAERECLRDLADGGCRWIEIHEPAATAVGSDATAWARFERLHRELTHGLGDVHLSLAITGGDVDPDGYVAILAGAYASLAVDLVDGPENWRLVVATPGDRGIVAGVVSPRDDVPRGPELLLWAAGYAASTGGRGMTRVGLATTGSLATLDWTTAADRVRELGEGARLATAPREEQARTLDPRAIDARSAALGRYEPPRKRSQRPR